MKKLNVFKTKCPCGEGIQTAVVKPKAFSHTVQQMKCSACFSIFLLSCFVIKGHYPKAYQTDFEILTLTQKAKNKVKDQIRAEKGA